MLGVVVYYESIKRELKGGERVQKKRKKKKRMQLSGMGGLRRGGEALKKEDEDWKKREKDSGAALYEENYIVSQGAKEKEFTSVKLKDEIVAFSQRMEFLMGVDVDGDGIVGNDMRKDKDVARGRENLDKAAHDEERVLEAERWSARLKAVEEDVREAKLEKARETVRVPTVGKKDNLRRHEAQAREFDVYHRSVEHTVENRTNVRVTLQTRGQLFIALQNLGDAVKKSAQLARNETQGDMTDEMMKGAMKDVHSFQVRSFVVGGPMQFAKAYCPKVFCRLRSHFGLSYESFVRLVDTFVFGDGGRGSERRGGILSTVGEDTSTDEIRRWSSLSEDECQRVVSVEDGVLNECEKPSHQLLSSNRRTGCVVSKIPINNV